MTREQIIDLLTFARVYDARVTVGKAEAAAWFLALNRVPLTTAQTAVTAHYTAPIEPGHEYPRIAPGHVMAYFQAGNRPEQRSLPAIEAAKADPETVARCRAKMEADIARAAAKFALPGEGDEVPRWRPGMDKRKLALAQVEACRNRRARGGAA